MSYWQRYIAYLKEWAETHSGEEFTGMSPACYDEWMDNENIEREPGITEVLHKLRKEYPNLDIECTCSACPEQYEIWDNEDEDCPQIGYLRLRDGHFTAEYPDVGGELVYKACPNGCMLFEDEERERYMMEAIRACVERHKQSK